MLYLIQNEIKMLEAKLDCIEAELRGLPDGSVRCTSNRGTDQFYVNGKYISKKQINTVKDIVQRDYYEKLKPAIEKRLYVLREAELCYTSHEIENCSAKFCKARRKLITPIAERAIVWMFLEGHYLQDIVAQSLDTRQHGAPELVERGHLLLLGTHPYMAFIYQRMRPASGLAPLPFVALLRGPDLCGEYLCLRILDHARHIGGEPLSASARPLDPEFVEVSVAEAESGSPPM